MGKKYRKSDADVDFDPYDEDENWEDEDFDLDQLAQDIHSTDWGRDRYRYERISARRKIEHYDEMRRLRDEIEDWERYGLDQH